MSVHTATYDASRKDYICNYCATATDYCAEIEGFPAYPRVSLDGAVTFPAMELGQTWNGWATPRMTPVAVEQVLRALVREAPDYYSFIKDENGRGFILRRTDEDDEILAVGPDNLITFEGWTFEQVTAMTCRTCGHVGIPTDQGTCSNCFRD